jgi:hypothetical protein
MLNSVVLDAQPVSKSVHSGKSAAMRKKMRTLDALLNGDAREQRETYKYLKRALNAERASHRKLFS